MTFYSKSLFEVKKDKAKLKEYFIPSIKRKKEYWAGILFGKELRSLIVLRLTVLNYMDGREEEHSDRVTNNRRRKGEEREKS